MKNNVLKCTLLILIVYTLFACSNEAGSEDLVSKSLVIALSNEPEEGFDPCLGWGQNAHPLIQSTLVTTDTDMHIVNDLATSYSVSDDSLVWTFTIRDDVQFSDGTMLTAKDVAFTFSTTKESASVVDLTILKSIRIIDDVSIEFTLHKPQMTFLTTVAQIGIVPADYYSSNYAEKPIGSGPFTLLQWNRGEQVILGVNELYYGQKPAFNRVTIVFMNEETAYAAAMRGDVDISYTNSNIAKNTLENMTLLNFKTIDNRGITLPTVPNEGLQDDEGNTIGNDVTSDLAIRRALSYGIDRKALVVDCLNNFGTPAFTECDGMPWASTEAVVEYRLDYALELLEAAGWVLQDDGIRSKNGIRAEFTLLYNAGDSTRQALSVAVAEQAKQLGIDIRIKGTNWDEIEKLMHSNAVLMGFGSQNPMETYYLYHSSNKGKDFYNPEYYDNDVIDEHLEVALEQTDYKRFLELYKNVQWDGSSGVSTRGDIPFLWLVNIDHLYFADEKLDLGKQRIHPHGHSWPLLTNLVDWKWKPNE